MKQKTFGLFLGVFVILALVGSAILPSASASDVLAIGAKMENFTLADPDGKQHKFDDLKGKNGTVIVFLSAQCPVVNKFYKDRIVQFGKELSEKGVNVIGLNSNVTETPEQIKTNTEQRGYTFPVLIDKGNVIADKLGATVTPEVFLFDKDGKLVYRGAIDNDRAGTNITANYLNDAVSATIAGKTVAKTEAAAFGCSIKRAN